MYLVNEIARRGHTAYYVYTLSRPDGTVFYVGKGKGMRIHDHEANARRGGKSARARTIRDIWANGGQVGKSILLVTEDEAEAFAEEKRLIAQIGRITLTNVSPGGEGKCLIDDVVKDRMRLRRHSAETKARMSASRREFWERREAAGIPPDEKVVERMRRFSAEAKGKPKSEEFKQHLCEVKTGIPRPESVRMAVSLGKLKNSDLTADDIRRIRERRANGELGRVIAADYGISEVRVCKIAKRHIYRFIE